MLAHVPHPFHLVRVSTKRFHSLSDLWRHDAKMTVKCLTCGNERAFDPIELGRWCEPKVRHVIRVREHRSANLSAIADRMRCKCGSKRIDWWPKNRD